MTTLLVAPRSQSSSQTVIGIGLACVIISAWVACHLYGVFFHRWTAWDVLAAPALVALQCWLNVGLFIVAHDGMHGSLAPFHPRINRSIGQLCLALYAGFSYDRLIRPHFDHHRHSGTALDPDFNAEDPEHFWRWFMTFFRRYFGWRSLAIITGVVVVYAIAGAGLANMMVLWALPALLSALQLFYFGTYLPHRHEDEHFADRHNARSTGYPWLVSLFTCFHFGCHHEHHLAPHVPWWKLPGVRLP